MKRTITFWKNYGHPAIRGRTEELFKVSWNDDTAEWVRNENGKYWGMYKLDTTEVRRLNRRPEDMGTVNEIYDEDEEIVSEVAEALNVDHLEAEDATVTPKADLGEEK